MAKNGANQKSNSEPEFQILSPLESGGVSIGGTVVEGEQSFSEKQVFESMRVVGNATFWEFVDVDRFLVEGAATFYDTVTSDDFYCTGNTLLKQRLICGTAAFYGKSEIYGSVHADRLTVADTLTVRGNIHAIQLNVTGKLLIGRNIFADDTVILGSIHSSAKVQTMGFRLVANGTTSSMVELKADYVTVESKARNPAGFVLIVDTLDSEVVSVAHTKADYIFCEKCRIGAGSVVRRLECHEEPVIEEGAVVGEIKRF